MPALHAIYGYEKFFRFRWEQKESFIIVEQDVMPDAEHLFSMMACPSDVCFSGYVYPDGHYEPGRHLGCTKFTAEFIKKHLNLFQDRQHPMDRVMINTIISEAAGKYPHICYHDYVMHLHPSRITSEEDKQKYGP